VIGAVLVALALPWGGAGGRPLATSGPVLAGAAATSHADYIVQPGDTLWSIAVRLDPKGDPRVVVGQLEAQTGSDTVVPGEHLRLP
jgi:nucleoid-associated protein YgaU